MEPRIFISYSREDEKQAKSILALLRREGYSVWIDQEAIAGASIWSDEIVENIKQCDIFVAMLSAHSVASPNVGKEIALAAEHGKVILPIEVGHVELPGRLEYALAGIQRTSYHDEDAILHAVRSQMARLTGVAAAESLRHAAPHWLRRPVTITSLAVVLIAAGFFAYSRRGAEAAVPVNSVAVLPFSTINLDRDSTKNLDIISEAIVTRLASVHQLTTMPAAAISSYKDSRLSSLAIAQELKARFLVEGIVRKWHDVNYVCARVIDSKRGGEIWEESYNGNNTELFSIRERLCSDLSGFLNGLSNDEASLAATERNAAAHPNDARAVADLARALLATDKTRSIELFRQAIKLDPDNLSYYLSAGIVATRLGDDGGAREFGNQAVDRMRRLLQQHPDSMDLAANYLVAMDLAGRGDKAEVIYDSLLKLHPTDVRLNYNLACNLAKQGKTSQALDVLEKLLVIAPGKKGEVMSDPDFNNIRSNPRYFKLMNATDQQQ